MVSSASTHSTSPLNVEDYCESDNDSDTNESPDTVMEQFSDSKSPIPPAADPQLLQKTLREALKAASQQRQQQQVNKKPRQTPPAPQRSAQGSRARNQASNESSTNPTLEQLSSLLPFMLQGKENQDI